MGLSNADLFRLASDMADRIEALTAERDEYKRLAGIADTLARECRIHESRAENAEAENARVREAVEGGMSEIRDYTKEVGVTLALELAMGWLSTAISTRKETE
jgi:hypothetical protein